MPAVYLCNVIGDSVSTETAFRPDLPAGSAFVCLMIDEAKGRAVVASPDNTLTGTGITKLQAATWAALRTAATSMIQSNAVKTWLTNNGYPVPGATSPTWAQTILYVARLVNPAADLAVTQIG